MAADCSAGVGQQSADINLQNFKLILGIMEQAVQDNQADARAWREIARRSAQNAATFDHAVNMLGLLAGQTGVTENQQTVSPAGTAASEAIKAGTGVAAEQVAANVANLVSVLTPIVGATLAQQLAVAIAALTPVTVTASGGASTPSQTQAKPTSSAS